MCNAESRQRSLRATRARMSRSTTESTPPERPATRRSDGLTMSSSCAATRPTRSGLLLLDFLELAIADQLLESGLEQLVERRFLELPPGVLQRLLDALHGRVLVAVRAAQRLADDAVNQAKRLQAG